MSKSRNNADLVRAAEAQGFRVKQTRKGWTVYGKDGTSTVGFHRTPTDCRAKANAKADLRKIGVEV